MKHLVKKIVKIQENPILQKYPDLDDVLLRVNELENNMLITDCSTFYKTYFSKNVKVGLRKVFKIHDFKEDVFGVRAAVQIMGLFQIQEVFSEKKKILFVETNNEKSEMKTIVTAFFDQDYLRKYGQQHGKFYDYFKTHNKTWNTSLQDLFQVKVELLQDLIPKKEITNLEFKV
jgi:predicted Ser/Thr protein kinase